MITIDQDSKGRKYLQVEFSWADGLVDNVRYTYIPKAVNDYPNEDIIRIKKFNENGKSRGQMGVDIPLKDFKKIHGELFLREILG